MNAVNDPKMREPSPAQALRRYMSDRRVASLDSLVLGLDMERSVVSYELERMIASGEVEVLSIRWRGKNSDRTGHPQTAEYYRVRREVDINQLLERETPVLSALLRRWWNQPVRLTQF